MTPQRFSDLFNETVQAASTLLGVKGGEYAPGDDRLGNFKLAATRLGMLPEQVLLVYLDKHMQAIQHWVGDQAAGTDRPRSEPITGRVLDAINYLILLQGLIEEREPKTGAAAFSSRLAQPQQEQPQTKQITLGEALLQRGRKDAP